MMVTDPIADMLTRIRNAQMTKKETVSMPDSKMKKAIADILLEEGYISGVKQLKGDKEPTLLITLKYDAKNNKVITGLKRISKPGLRVHAGCSELPEVLNGLGIAIVSTNKGVMTSKKAKELNIGGEVLCYVW